MAQLGGEYEEILMTPLKVPVGHLVKVERVPRDHLDTARVKHFATGPYEGIVINQAANETPCEIKPDTAKWFTAHVADLKSGHPDSLTKERRELRFWIHPDYTRKANSITERFFQGVLESFPKASIQFLINVLSLVKDFPEVLRLELEMRPMRPGDTEHGTILAGLTPSTPDPDRKKKRKKKKKHGKQDDMQYEEDGSLGGSYGDLVEGQIGHAHRGADGRSLDYSARVVPSQDDMITRSTVGSLGSQGSYQHSQTTSEMLESPVVAQTVGMTGSRGNANYAAQLRAGANHRTEDLSVEERVEEVIVPESSYYTGARGSQSYASELTRSVKQTTTQHVSSLSGSRVTTTKTVVMQGGVGISQDDFNRQQGVQGDFSFQQDFSSAMTSAYPGQAGMMKKKPVLSWKGWEVIKATKKHRILTALEDAYPNILGVDDLVRTTDMKPVDVMYLLNNISEGGMVQQIAKGRWMRVQATPKHVEYRRDSKNVAHMIEPKRKHEFKMVTHIPRLPAEEQPTIAVITLLYCEKIAVDAMMEPKTTYVRAKTDGESQVYTVGFIGKHRVVCTKLPRVGREQGAVIASGNTVTRLLGTFSKIEHVVLVGVGGGVPCYNDERRHVRCGDVIISKPEIDGNTIYLNVTKFENSKFTVLGWGPQDDSLIRMTNTLMHQQSAANSARALPWEQYLDEALEELGETESATRFNRPSLENDRLYLTVDGKSVEVPHPAPLPGSRRRDEMPFLHFGMVATGKPIIKDQMVRQAFTDKHGVKMLDVGFQTVMESIEGNRKESFVIIRGVSDYVDGTRREEWQPYASLAAAAVLKALVLELPTPEDDDD